MQPYELLEQKWAEFNQLDPAGMVVCSSGTSALHLGLEALQLPQGSEVITSDFNMIAVPRAVSMAGLTPVFVDCDDKLLMDFNLVPPPSRTLKAIIPVHIYGRRWPTNWLPDTWAIKRIEDYAEAHGLRPDSSCDVACWSFYKNKVVAGEEGGAVWFRNNDHAKLARQLRSLGFTDKHDFMHVPRGVNARMANVLALPILESLKNVESNMKERRYIEELYNAECPDSWKMPSRDVVWCYDLRIRGMSKEQQTKIVQMLNKANIAARFAFQPMSSQEEYKSNKLVSSSTPSNASVLANEVIYLPVTPGRPRCDKIAFSIMKDVAKSFSLL